MLTLWNAFMLAIDINTLFLGDGRNIKLLGQIHKLGDSFASAYNFLSFINELSGGLFQILSDAAWIAYQQDLKAQFEVQNMLKLRELVRIYAELAYMYTCLRPMQRVNIGCLFRVIRKDPECESWCCQG